MANWSTKTIKIDWDFSPTKDMVNWLYTKSYSDLRAEKIMMNYTRHGIHLEIILPHKISFWRSIELRSLFHDDPKRIVFDILRHRAGAKMIDALWDKKTKIKQKVS